MTVEAAAMQPFPHDNSRTFRLKMMLCAHQKCARRLYMSLLCLYTQQTCKLHCPVVALWCHNCPHVTLEGHWSWPSFTGRLCSSSSYPSLLPLFIQVCLWSAEVPFCSSQKSPCLAQEPLWCHPSGQNCKTEPCATKRCPFCILHSGPWKACVHHFVSEGCCC